MREKRPEGVRRQHYDFAQILHEPNERPSKRVEKSSEHLLSPLGTQRLRFCFWTKLGRNCADKTRIEREFTKDRADFAKGHGGLVEFEVNQIVVAIDFITQTRNRRELVVELQDLVQIAQTGGVNFQFQHVTSKFTDDAT